MIYIDLFAHSFSAVSLTLFPRIGSSWTSRKHSPILTDMTHKTKFCFQYSRSQYSHLSCLRIFSFVTFIAIWTDTSSHLSSHFLINHWSISWSNVSFNFNPKWKHDTVNYQIPPFFPNWFSLPWCRMYHCIWHANAVWLRSGLASCLISWLSSWYFFYTWKVAFLKDVGQKLSEVSPRGLNGMSVVMTILLSSCFIPSTVPSLFHSDIVN